MADPGDAFAKPMAWWGTIQAAVSARMTTAEVWTAIQARSAELGLPTPPTMFLAVNEIRSQAAQLRNASERLTAAPATDAITSALLAPLPYGNLGGGAGPRTFDVRVNYTAVRTGQVETDYITLRYTGGLPATVGELRAEAELVAESLVEGYGASLTSIGAIQIGEL
jgi:hypothetical protein